MPFRWIVFAGFSSTCLVVIVCNSHYVEIICGVHNWIEILELIDVVHDSSIFVREARH